MKRGNQGFTLLEVMAAIVIMALAFAMLLKAMGTSTALTHAASMRTQAAAWGQSLLDGTYAMTPPVPGTHVGRFNDTYHWRLDVTPWHPQKPGLSQQPWSQSGRVKLYALNLAVMWGPPSREHVLHFATLRAVRESPDAGQSP